jgi:hypothetical protein
MHHLRLELSSERTLKLEELRETLIEILPSDVSETETFPTAHYICFGCSGTCFLACDSSCWSSCQATCLTGCAYKCRGVAMDFA